VQDTHSITANMLVALTAKRQNEAGLKLTRWPAAQKKWGQDFAMTHWTAISATITGIKSLALVPSYFSHTLLTLIDTHIPSPGSTLLRKIKDAGSDMAEYRQQHQDLQRSLPSEIITKWRMEVEAWEADPSVLNPFEQVIISRLLLHIQLRLKSNSI
jgi:hypothetical protein